MKFRLTYDGELRSAQTKNTDKSHVHNIRRHFHEQLRILWDQDPLNGYKKYCLEKPVSPKEHNHIVRIRDCDFSCIVHSRSFLLARLDIIFLRPTPPGAIFDKSGDIDNRIKTLIDALRIPKDGELPVGWEPGEDENPFHCLLEDDKLIYAFNVETDSLLRNNFKVHDVNLNISVSLAASKGTIGNFSLVI